MPNDIPARAPAEVAFEESTTCGAVRCQHTANLAVDLLAALIEDRAKEHDGWVPIDELRSLFEQFKAAPGELGRFYERTYDDCSGSHDALSLHEFDQWDAFDHLLAEALLAVPKPGVWDSEVHQDDHRLPQRALPPLIRALTCLLGRGFVGRVRVACHNLEDRARERHGDDFSWERFAQGNAAKSLLLRVMLRLAETLDTPEAGGHRVVEMINTDLGNMRVVSGVYQPGPPVIFSEAQFRQALVSLFSVAPDAVSPEIRHGGGPDAVPITSGDLRRLINFRRRLAP